MGVLSRITIFPIKSLTGVCVPGGRVLPSAALEFDRRFVLVDSSGQYITAKRTAAVHAVRAEYDLEQMTVTLSHSGQADSADCCSLLERHCGMAEWFSDYFGDSVSVREAPRTGVPDDLEAGGPTIVAEKTLELVAGWFEGLTLDEVRCRFRTNLEVSEVEPFWEDRLYAQTGTGRRFRIGNVELAGARPCQRCAVPPRNSVTGDVTAGFIRTFSERRRDLLPDWAERDRFDHYYRLATNTVLPDGRGGDIAVGEPVLSGST